MGFWSFERLIANAFLFTVSGILTGAVVSAVGSALEQLPGVPYSVAYVIFFIVLPIQGFVSDVEDMVIRGLIFTFSVMIFSAYFGDALEVLAAWVAFLLSIMIAGLKEYYWW